MQPLVSVVTPFYNIAEHLSECIESVLGQTYRNFEYVLLDNCSTDGSLEIAEKYAKLDSRIRLYRNDAVLDQVPNYNAALAKISTQSVYTKIIEADNWAFPECLDRFVALAEANPSVGVLSSYNITERTVRFSGLHYSESVIPGRDIARRQLLEKLYVFGAPTTVMMRSSFVRERERYYDESAPFAEDQSACFEILRNWDFGFVHQILTFVRTDNISILSALRTLDPRSLDIVLLLSRHGRDFLSSTEYDQAFARARRRHYQSLARGLLGGRGARLLKYHGDGLATAGLSLSPFTLLYFMASELLSTLLCPGQIAGKLRNYFR